ncbi:uncharacterized protein SPPG_06433 [Spizellomyces punctatus DAOM BR117]|uniref:Oxidoreductase n=1 Tax=Spizellomyces punctatus (strain DAOM BR117) TaxID=645134 RepID=A0A0L0HAU3_SPIPD|nr:uncharacterized protein SPPG_06433 [Spizellomyces punctatus DAOM BR117]KNC98014.1 hypothetical protein SPPG_06433 [Spizellomyces punctatus DAOM BR117]|eukprot:XP_016606054.1 hypothetical protein SPPG_06433 [Spizellomyces punctatus DAOM BR117]
MSITVGIIGAGLSARTFHAPFITSSPHFQLKSFLRTKADPVPSFESIPVTTDSNDFLKSVDLVIITSPTYLHYQHAKQALEAGKHIIVEKPFTATYAEAQELISLAKEKKRVLAVYQNRRWDGDFLTVAKLLNDDAFGRVVELESRYERFRNFVKPDAWREEDYPGSGILYDLGSHLIDQAITLFGPPTSITAFIRNFRQLSAPTDDAFTINLHYTVPHPKLVTLKSTMLAAHPGPRFTVHGTKGTFIKHGLDPQEGQLRSEILPTAPEFGAEAENMYGEMWTPDTPAPTKIETIKGAYADFFENVAEAIRAESSEALVVKPEQAAVVIRAIELAQKSSAEGRTILF